MLLLNKIEKLLNLFMGGFPPTRVFETLQQGLLEKVNSRWPKDFLASPSILRTVGKLHGAIDVPPGLEKIRKITDENRMLNQGPLDISDS